MYDYVDRPVASLNHGGQLLVWAMRRWVEAMRARTCPAAPIAPGFARWRLLGALPPFLRMMALFNRHGRETFGFCALTCPQVSEHEALIVALVGDLGQRPASAIRHSVELLVEEDAVGPLTLCLMQLGQTLAASDLQPCRLRLDHHTGPAHPGGIPGG
ncbi:hypothetical protein ACFOON_02115 [Novosphingobium piscinae]|uniref:Uncharacterized protein n=1 Tax=Novosphingobium piscinae TaxID=1507448 RepID=A0A7X1KNR4_9SPHN|nr:hypothetical protein [Novosphingobium piscinae]MBC2667620.1 hypothetical protein [Novosphingobium piscinae]